MRFRYETFHVYSLTIHSPTHHWLLQRFYNILVDLMIWHETVFLKETSQAVDIWTITGSLTMQLWVVAAWLVITLRTVCWHDFFDVTTSNHFSLRPVVYCEKWHHHTAFVMYLTTGSHIVCAGCRGWVNRWMENRSHNFSYCHTVVFQCNA